jgi:hypothetical protein
MYTLSIDITCFLDVKVASSQLRLTTKFANRYNEAASRTYTAVQLFTPLHLSSQALSANVSASLLTTKFANRYSEPSSVNQRQHPAS